jgi:hypothetical protein
VKTPLPHLIVDVTLYPTDVGGRRSPTRAKWFICPCKLTKNADIAWDCRLYYDAPIAPGETRRGVGAVFLSKDGLPLFRQAGRFYLWDGRIIGEATVVEPTPLEPGPA